MTYNCQCIVCTGRGAFQPLQRDPPPIRKPPPKPQWAPYNRDPRQISLALWGDPK